MSFEQAENSLVNKLKITNEFIEKFNIIFNIKKNNEKFLENNSELNKLSNDFELKYLKYINIKRFAIPVIGRISSGKSTFLNFLLGLNDILQENTNNTTKFVCIIRHNPSLNKPKAYEVILEERKNENSLENIENIENIENSKIKFPKFNFEKGKELEGDIKNIIIKRNNKLSDSKYYHLIKREEYFMIIETKISFFNNKELEEYSQIFEFMDIPGLNDKNYFFRINILPVITYNIKFSFFIFDFEKIKDSDSFNIIEWFRNTTINKKNENCFYILNKIDSSTNKKEDEIEYFKNFIHDKFEVDININHFFGINSLLLSKESERFNNFESYLKYKIADIQDGEGKNFKSYLKKEMEKDLNIPKIYLNLYENSISKDNDEKIIEIINEINNVLEMKNFEIFLNKNDYLKFSEIFKRNIPIENDNSKDTKEIIKKLICSIKNSIKSFVNLTEYKKLLDDLDKIIKNNNNNNIFNKSMIKFKQKNDFKYSLEKMKSIKNMILEPLLKIESNNKFIKRMEGNYNGLVKLLIYERKIRIALLGLYSSGKSTILNALIGKKILPTSNDICTNRGIIIRYHDKDEPELYKTKFIKNPDLNYYIFEDNDEVYAKGFKRVKKELEILNQVNCKFEDSFFILKIKIDFLNKFCIKNEIKERIEFIDFPGLNTVNKFFDKQIFDPLMEFIDGFIFINKNNLITEQSNNEILKEIINKIESRKYDLNSDSYFFVINNFTGEILDIKDSQKKLNEIFFEMFYLKEGLWGKNMLNEPKLIQFNAKKYEIHLDFKEKICDFKKFMESCIKNMIDDGEENLLKYFNENYLSQLYLKNQIMKQWNYQIF